MSDLNHQIQGDPKLNSAQFGLRLKQVRLKANMTQATLAKFISKPNGKALQRTTVAQWERGESKPSITTIEQVSALLGVKSKYLAYGDTEEPVVVTPTADEMGYAHVPEIVFGKTPSKRKSTGKWALPTGYLRNELGVSLDSAMIYKVERSYQDSKFELGDRLIVDRSQTDPSPPGMFLYWDGIGPQIGDMSILPRQDPTSSLVVRVKTPDHSYELPLDGVVIIGRIRGKIGKL